MHDAQLLHNTSLQNCDKHYRFGANYLATVLPLSKGTDILISFRQLIIYW